MILKMLDEQCLKLAELIYRVAGFAIPYHCNNYLYLLLIYHLYLPDRDGATCCDRVRFFSRNGYVPYHFYEYAQQVQLSLRHGDAWNDNP